MIDTNFAARRRQPYLSEESFLNTLRHYEEGEALYRKDLEAQDILPGNRERMHHVIAEGRWDSFRLSHTAGESPAILAQLLTGVVEAFEVYVDAGFAIPDDQYEPSFPMTDMIDVYNDFLHLLCFAILLRRDDLVLRVHGLIDGTDYDKDDAVIERLLCFYLPDRPELDEVYWDKPYGQLLDAIESPTAPVRAAAMKKYVKVWYKSMKGQAFFWGKHEQIQPDFSPYVGYWAMCAGAFTYLFDLDDSAYRDELVYPKDLVDYARSVSRFTQASTAAPLVALRTEGGQPCPQAGYWATPAQQGSRRLFSAGEIMPTFEHSAYGATIWQWSEEQ